MGVKSGTPGGSSLSAWLGLRYTVGLSDCDSLSYLSSFFCVTLKFTEQQMMTVLF